MQVPIFQVDAFAGELFAGNPAAVMPLDDWLPDDLLQKIAQENNLSETAYLVAADGGFALRWFTPGQEVDLCGHATLAAAHVLFRHLDHGGDTVRFDTRSGELVVTRNAAALTLDFPVAETVPADVDRAVCAALGDVASEVLLVPGNPGKVMYVYEFEEDVARLTPDFPALLAASPQCVIATAPGDDCDVVSRFFAPQVGIDEDPVTGSSHCALVPYWSGRLGLARLACRQISRRGGELDCRLEGRRVYMTGTGVTYLQGTVTL